ncbi:c-type cytochrome [Gallaecimonas kandeliae]|uniref:c-type cytochrome n=1 Tax=Gallaecimonas kandeliae TaxID=3029055 RepID=UPI00264A0878|nr:c-type cytochrome [Gallaecimonas kandeliae]WKE64024.1 c-type cytochrome [Gallaecimonas kandeliae]
MRFPSFLLAALVAGQALAAPAQLSLCASCHGSDGQGIDPAGPRLAGQSAQYLANQLHLFQAGSRQNPIMQPMAAMVQGDAVQELADYFAGQKVAEPPLHKRGEQPVIEGIGEKLAYQGDWSRELPSCVSCHGPSGIGGGIFPRLAGQQQQYLENQLRAWQQGTRKGDPDGVMAHLAGKLSAEEVTAVAHYFASLK